MFDFPSSPADGQIYGNYTYRNGVWMQEATSQPTAETRNRVCNPAMQISQENGNGSVTSSMYPVDQFIMSSAIATVTAARQATGSANGNACLTTSIATAKPSLVAGDYWQIQQFIEGTRIKDFQWGSANAKQVVARFWVLSNVTGTYTFYIKNAPTVDRAFCAPFTITTPSVWTLVTIVIPADTTGTWLTDNSRGATIGWGLAAGSTFNTGVAGWQSGSNPVQIAGQTNLAAGVNSLYLGDVGLYLDPQNTGVAPPFQTPDEAQEITACQRYFQWVAFQFWGNITSGNAYLGLGKVAVPMRIAPAMGGGINISNTAFPATVGTYSVFNVLGGGTNENRTCNTTGTGGFQSVAAANARM